MNDPLKPTVIAAEARTAGVNDSAHPAIQAINRAQACKSRIGGRGQQADAAVRAVKARCHVRGMHGERRDFSAAQRATRALAALPPGGMLGDKFFGTDESLRAGINGGSWHFGFSAQVI